VLLRDAAPGALGSDCSPALRDLYAAAIAAPGGEGPFGLGRRGPGICPGEGSRFDSPASRLGPGTLAKQPPIRGLILKSLIQNLLLCRSALKNHQTR